MCGSFREEEGAFMVIRGLVNQKAVEIKPD